MKPPAKTRDVDMSQMESMPPIETTFANEEIAIPVKCDVHPWMKSCIAVFAHPYFATTGSDGTFELRNVPPGTYTLTAWHEILGTSEQKVTVGASGSRSVEFVFKENRQ